MTPSLRCATPWRTVALLTPDAPTAHVRGGTHEEVLAAYRRICRSPVPSPLGTVPPRRAPAAWWTWWRRDRQEAGR